MVQSCYLGGNFTQTDSAELLIALYFALCNYPHGTVSIHTIPIQIVLCTILMNIYGWKCDVGLAGKAEFLVALQVLFA